MDNQKEKFIDFTKKGGKIETGTVDPVEIDAQLEDLKGRLEVNASKMVDLQQERAEMYKEVDKLSAIKSQIPE